MRINPADKQAPGDTGSPMILTGITVSPGVAVGSAVVFPGVEVSPGKHGPGASGCDPDHEAERLSAALAQSLNDLAELVTRTREDTGMEAAHIFRSQQTMLEDAALQEELHHAVTAGGHTAEAAVTEVLNRYVALFEAMDSTALNRDRREDLQDVQRRVLRVLQGSAGPSFASLSHGSVVVAEELFPSDAIVIPRDRVTAIITERGGITSHAAILARNFRIPAAVGVAGATASIRPGAPVVLDGTHGETARVHVHPAGATLGRLKRAQLRYAARQEAFAQERDRDPVTLDGRRMMLSANVSSVEEAHHAVASGARSIGLFRTEFLFMQRGGKNAERWQRQTYHELARMFPEAPVTIRTLDIGADKPVPGISPPQEANPALGYRGIRVSLDRPELLRGQLRAAVDAAASGTVQILVPMVTGPQEMRQVLDILHDVAGKTNLPAVGAMIEVPSAVFMVDELAELVDFVSIGTNDLTQYLLAADRNNSRIQQYFQPLHPAVFRAIHQVVTGAHRHGLPVGVCGELGGMPQAIPVLVGLGVDELSMAPHALPEAVHVIRRIDSRQAASLARDVLAAPDTAAVLATIKRRRKEPGLV